MSQPFVSIIIPCYNVADYLDACLQSVCNQSYSDWEAILVDDGSKDTTPQICDRWANTDNRRIKVIHQQNQGVSVARNAGIAAACGKYVCFVDSDDIVDSKYLSALIETQAKNKAALTISGLTMYSKLGEEIFQVPETVFHKSIFQNLFSLSDYQFLLRGPVCKLFDLNIIKSNRLKFECSVHFGEDSIFVLQYCLLIDKIAFSEDVSYHYFRRPTGLVYSKCHRRDSVNEIRAFTHIFKEWAARFGAQYYSIPYFYDTLRMIYGRFCDGSTADYGFWEYIDGYANLDAKVYERLYPAQTAKAKIYIKMLQYIPRILGAIEFVMQK